MGDVIPLNPREPKPFDISTLPIPAALMLEVLKLKWETGHKFCKFPSQFSVIADILQQNGLAAWGKGKDTELISVALTYKGIRLLIDPNFTDPHEPKGGMVR
jgi:hypothetical protein